MIISGQHGSRDMSNERLIDTRESQQGATILHTMYTTIDTTIQSGANTEVRDKCYTQEYCISATETDDTAQ